MSRCSMGVGCDEFGVCYDDAHGALLMCPLYRADFVTIMLAIRRRRRRK